MPSCAACSSCLRLLCTPSSTSPSGNGASTGRSSRYRARTLSESSCVGKTTTSPSARTTATKRVSSVRGSGERNGSEYFERKPRELGRWSTARTRIPARPSDRIAASPLTQPTSITAAATLMRRFCRRGVVSDPATSAGHVPCLARKWGCAAGFGAGRVLGSTPVPVREADRWRGPGGTGRFPQRLPEHVERGEVVGGRLPVARDGVRPHLLRLGRPGDHRGHGRLRGKSADRNLQQRQAPLAPEALQRLDAIPLLVCEHVLPSRQARALGLRLSAPVLAGEQAAGEREVGQHTEAEPLAHGQQLLFGLAPQQRVLILRADRTHPPVLARERVDLLDPCRL